MGLEHAAEYNEMGERVGERESEPVHASSSNETKRERERPGGMGISNHHHALDDSGGASWSRGSMTLSEEISAISQIEDNSVSGLTKVNS